MAPGSVELGSYELSGAVVLPVPFAFVAVVDAMLIGAVAGLVTGLALGRRDETREGAAKLLNARLAAELTAAIREDMHEALQDELYALVQRLQDAEGERAAAASAEAAATPPFKTPFKGEDSADEEPEEEQTDGVEEEEEESASDVEVPDPAEQVAVEYSSDDDESEDDVMSVQEAIRRFNRSRSQQGTPVNLSRTPSAETVVQEGAPHVQANGTAAAPEDVVEEEPVEQAIGEEPDPADGEHREPQPAQDDEEEEAVVEAQPAEESMPVPDFSYRVRNRSIATPASSEQPAAIPRRGLKPQLEYRRRGSSVSRKPAVPSAAAANGVKETVRLRLNRQEEEADARQEARDAVREELEREGISALLQNGDLVGILAALDLAPRGALPVGAAATRTAVEGAYCKALLKVHPDRVAGRGLGVAAEARAEELFKMLHDARSAWDAVQSRREQFEERKARAAANAAKRAEEARQRAASQKPEVPPTAAEAEDKRAARLATRAARLAAVRARRGAW